MSAETPEERLRRSLDELCKRLVEDGLSVSVDDSVYDSLDDDDEDDEAKSTEEYWKSISV